MKKKCFITVIVSILVVLLFSTAFASEFQRKLLLQQYLQVGPGDWDTITKNNKNLLDTAFLDMAKENYYKMILWATDKAKKENTSRKIPDSTFVFANLADYVGKEINTPSNLRKQLADEYIQDGKIDTAAEILNSILITEPNDLTVAEELADLFLKMNMPSEAMQAYQHILAKDGNNQTALYRLGTMYMSLGHYQKTVELYKKLLQINPAHLQAKQFVDLYEGNVKTSDNRKVNDNAVQHFMSAERLYGQNKYSEAAEQYAMAIESDPNFYQAYANLGECLTKLQKYQDAVDVLDNAIKIQPQNPQAYHFMGLALEKQYNFNLQKSVLNKAVENYVKALEIDSKYTPVKEDLERAQKRLNNELKEPHMEQNNEQKPGQDNPEAE